MADCMFIGLENQIGFRSTKNKKKRTVDKLLTNLLNVNNLKKKVGSCGVYMNGK